MMKSEWRTRHWNIDEREYRQRGSKVDADEANGKESVERIFSREWWVFGSVGAPKVPLSSRKCCPSRNLPRRWKNERFDRQRKWCDWPDCCSCCFFFSLTLFSHSLRDQRTKSGCCRPADPSVGWSLPRSVRMVLFENKDWQLQNFTQDILTSPNHTQRMQTMTAKNFNFYNASQLVSLPIVKWTDCHVQPRLPTVEWMFVRETLVNQDYGSDNLVEKRRGSVRGGN